MNTENRGDCPHSSFRQEDDKYFQPQLGTRMGVASDRYQGSKYLTHFMRSVLITSLKNFCSTGIDFKIDALPLMVSILLICTNVNTLILE
jgi:hypothetical protein